MTAQSSEPINIMKMKLSAIQQK
uniref:Uncharacterized protein n=1 Tax=Anguilla anguilla TaxID=7936 RepID=A0A0E9QR38_ANGAN